MIYNALFALFLINAAFLSIAFNMGPGAQSLANWLTVGLLWVIASVMFVAVVRAGRRGDAGDWSHFKPLANMGDQGLISRALSVVAMANYLSVPLAMGKPLTTFAVVGVWIGYMAIILHARKIVRVIGIKTLQA